MSDVHMLTLGLRGGCWTRLVDLVNEPNKLHETGGFQNRKRRWLVNMDAERKTITLDGDDIDFIQRQIRNKKGGGWQLEIYDIFVGQHKLFSRLDIRPRRKPS
jgi:hypothetical protein